MEKKQQLLIIDPQSELKFRGPFTRPVTTYMRLSNPTDKTILFKIKTTAPRKYCVRPNFGSLNPDSSVEVAISLQAFVFDPNEKNKHKFMVQSFIVPEGATNYDKLWKEVQPEELMDSKLRCVFEVPVEPPAGDSVDVTENLTKATNVKSGGEENVTDLQGDFEQAIAEVRKLREEESQLRQENLQLKEQILRSRITTDNTKEQFQNPYSPPATGQQQQIPAAHIAIAILIAVFSMLLGKFVL